MSSGKVPELVRSRAKALRMEKTVARWQEGRGSRGSGTQPGRIAEVTAAWWLRGSQRNGLDA